MKEQQRTRLTCDSLGHTALSKTPDSDSSERTARESKRSAPRPQVSAERYLALLRQSKLLSQERLDQLLGTFAARTDLAMTAPDFVAQSGEITPWQHSSLLFGRCHGFFLGGCKLLHWIGGGAMSDVYLGEHLASHSQMAVKVLKARCSDNSSVAERFCLEGRTMQKFVHPNIVRVYQQGQECGQLFLLMEYVDGSDLSSLVARHGTPSFAKAADYIRQAAAGLAYLHIRGIVHRDIKPGNLLVDSTGVVKIFDLGLARVPNDGEQSLTALHHETILGTPDYMAPEQVLDCHEVDGRADLYSLGGTLYFLLTGHAPFAEGTLARRLLKHQREAPESIYFKRPETPTALVEICRRLLAKRPRDRFASAEELSRTLSDWLASACTNADPEAGGQPPRADAQDDFAALARWSRFGP